MKKVWNVRVGQESELPLFWDYCCEAKSEHHPWARCVDSSLSPLFRSLLKLKFDESKGSDPSKPMEQLLDSLLAPITYTDKQVIPVLLIRLSLYTRLNLFAHIDKDGSGHELSGKRSVIFLLHLPTFFEHSYSLYPLMIRYQWHLRTIIISTLQDYQQHRLLIKRQENSTSCSWVKIREILII